MEAKHSGEQTFEMIKEKVHVGKVLISVISEDQLPFYLVAAFQSGFKVEKIAVKGQNYPHLSVKSDDESRRTVHNVKVQGEDNIAVSVEKPEGSRDDHSHFWEELASIRRLEQKGI